jgi:8-hydroxy-5-deazaflavin:NADPH oxidoreductase
MARFSTLTRRGFVAAAVMLPRCVYAAAAPLKIGFVCAGRMGGALGALFVKSGHEVMFSTRHPEELKDLAAGLGPLARAGTVAQAVAFGDIVVLVVPYSAMPDVAREAGAAIAKKPLVLDVSNPIVPRDGEPGAKAREEGPGLYLARLMPGAPIVRAFNAIGYDRLENDAKRSDKIGVPIAGDDMNALRLAGELIGEIGFAPVAVGNLAFGRYLIPGTPLGGEHSADELRKLAATLK